MALEKNVKNLLDWEYAISCETKAASISQKLEAALAEISRLQGLLPPNGTWAPPLKSNIYVASLAVSRSFSEKNTNTQGKAPVVAVQVLGEAEKVKSGVAETREGSVKKKKYMCSSELEMSDFGVAMLATAFA